MDIDNLAKIIVLLIYFSFPAACPASPNDSYPTEPDQSTKTIYLVSHGWHAGMVLKQSDIPENLWPENKDFINVKYLEVGWGDKDYYQTPDPHLGIAIKAAIWPTPSVLHIAGFNQTVTSYFPLSEIIEIQLSEAGFKQLIAYIEASYLKDLEGISRPIGRGLYGNSLFYLSNETYHLFKNCNAWTAEALKTAGVLINPAFIVTVEQLMDQANNFGSVIQTSKLD